MADIYSDRVEKPRDEGIEASRIEVDRKEKEKFQQLPSQGKKQAMLASFIASVRTFFTLLEPTKKFEGKWIEIEGIGDALESLKKKFEELREKDKSESSEFAEELSVIWINLQTKLTELEILFQKKTNPKENPFLALLESITAYPPEVEHSLGYYLDRSPGKTWMPFPFIAILRQLHEEAQKNLKIEKSLKDKKAKERENHSDFLSLWIGMIEEIVSFLLRKHFK